MATVELRDITKVYDKATEPAVNKLNLSIEDSEFVVLVGPSGCGKSTALRMVAGLEQITDGTLTIDNNVVNNLPPQARDIAMVFQNYALYPHMTVAGNLDYPLRIAGVSKSEISQRVNEIAATLQLTELLDRKPAHLSGGQRQRVAMGRALIRKPACFLMDEPLSNLDAKLRVSMRAEIARIQKELGVTTLYVTHDQVEAMTMGDRVVVLNAGELQQVDEPDILYNRPANIFVAGFIGSPAMNLFSSRFTMAGSEANVQMGEQQLSMDVSHAKALGLEEFNGKEITAGIRPDDLYDDVTVESTGVIEATIKLRESLGSEIICHLDVGVGRLQIDDPDLEELIAEGLSPQQDFVGRFAPSSTAKMGETKQIRIDTSRLHFFDPKTGLRIDKT